MIKIILQRYRAEKKRRQQLDLLDRLATEYHLQWFQRLTIHTAYKTAGFMVAARTARKYYRQQQRANEFFMSLSPIN